MLTSFLSYVPHFSFFYLFLKYFKNLSFDRIIFRKSLIFISILTLSFIGTLNINILRIILLLISNLILIYLFKVFGKRNPVFLIKLPTILFYAHSVVILFAFLSPTINSWLSGIDGDTSRIAGFVGYDYTGYFFGIYLLADFKSNRNKINVLFLIKLLASIFFILISGRFGIVILLYVLSYIYLNRITIKKTLLLAILSIITIVILNDQIKYIIDSSSLLWSYINDETNSDIIEEFNSNNSGDNAYYAASPITWLTKFMRPFLNYSSYIFPNSSPDVVDPGPAYYILNLGFLLTFYLYVHFVNFFKINNKIFWPFYIIYLLTDLKFHGLFVISCMFWLYLNLNKIKQNENQEIPS
jgi:hypothetical protein